MSFGLFQEWGKTSKGGPKLRISNQWVYPSRTCNLDGLNPGTQVEYETTAGGNDGKLTILQRIRPAPAGSSGMSSIGMGGQAGNAPVGSTITDGDILRSVSNVVGNLCANGKVLDGNVLKMFIEAAYEGFTTMGKAQAPAGGQSQGSAPKDPPRREPGQDDEPPPYDDSEVPW